jgi:hypothetical protein
MRCEVYSKISPFPLEVVAKIKGGHAVEWRFHTLLIDLYSHHEWFHAGPLLEGVIREIGEGVFDVESLPKAVRLSGRGAHRLSAEAKEWTSLGHRFSWLRRRGIIPPKHISDAMWLARWKVSPEERDRRRILVREYLDAVAPKGQPTGLKRAA